MKFDEYFHIKEMRMKMYIFLQRFVILSLWIGVVSIQFSGMASDVNGQNVTDEGLEVLTCGPTVFNA